MNNITNKTRDPLAYLLTWTTHGSWLHGDKRGSIYRDQNEYGTEFVEPNIGFVKTATRQMKSPVVFLKNDQQLIVECAIREVCCHRQWELCAHKCLSNHVHTVVLVDKVAPKIIMNQFKAYASRALHQHGCFVGSKTWTRGGSSRYLFSESTVLAAVKYVVNQCSAFGRLGSAPLRSRLSGGCRG